VPFSHIGRNLAGFLVRKAIRTLRQCQATTIALWQFTTLDQSGKRKSPASTRYVFTVPKSQARVGVFRGNNGRTMCLSS
jgi:hypothetical protein